MLAELAAAPGARLRVDLRAQTVTRPGGEVESFAVDPFARHCLLEGLDEIDYTLTQRAHRGLRAAPRRRGRAVPFLPLNS